jgi:hypothetical protein
LNEGWEKKIVLNNFLDTILFVWKSSQLKRINILKGNLNTILFYSLNSFKYKIKSNHFNLNQMKFFWKFEFIEESGSHSEIGISGCDSNKRWSDNGYIRGGRREARPCPPHNDFINASPSRSSKKKEAASAAASGLESSRSPKKKEASVITSMITVCSMLCLFREFKVLLLAVYLFRSSIS